MPSLRIGDRSRPAENLSRQAMSGWARGAGKGHACVSGGVAHGVESRERKARVSSDTTRKAVSTRVPMETAVGFGRI